jgi:hypothetical protein
VVPVRTYIAVKWLARFCRKLYQADAFEPSLQCSLRLKLLTSLFDENKLQAWYS